MKKLLVLAAALAALLCASPALAATCFWVGGTGSWSTSNAASWSSSSGGTASTCAATGGIPKQSLDIATFDGSSGGGTVTVDSSMSGTTIAEISMGAFTGTLDFSVNNPSMSIGGSTSGFQINGSGTRTLKLGSGTFTLIGISETWDAQTTTNLTFNAGTAVLCICSPVNGNAQSFKGGGLTYPNVTVGSRTNGSTVTFSGTGGGAVITTLTINAPSVSLFTASATTTIGTLITSGGSASNPLNLISGSAAAGSGIATVALSNSATVNWALIQDLTITTSTITATNSINLGGNTGVTFSSTPGGNGAPPMIGGGA